MTDWGLADDCFVGKGDLSSFLAANLGMLPSKKYLSNSKPGHTTGRSGRRTVGRRGGAGLG